MSSTFDKYFNVVASSLTILGFFIALSVLPNEYKYIGYYTSAGLGLIAVFALGLYFGKRASKLHPADFTEKHFVDNLLIYFAMKKESNANEEIIRLGIALSTPLWLSHHYLTRKQIGTYVYEAAIDTADTNAQIKVLIDDLGWTNVELGLYEEAEAKLRLGIKLAEEAKNEYYLSKGYRHLFGINYRNGDLEKAEQYLKLAVEYADKLPPDKKKDELIAEIHFAKSSLEYKKHNLDISLREIEAATEQYKNIPDREWTIKIAARRGDILLERNEIEEAMTVFRHGLHEAKKYHLNKQMVANMIGVSKCQYIRGDYEDAWKTSQAAYVIADGIGMFWEKHLINIEIEKVRSKIRH